MVFVLSRGGVREGARGMLDCVTLASPRSCVDFFALAANGP
jgi:hypothetical protein